MRRVLKWLGGNVELRWHRWELLAIALAVIVIDIVWNGAGVWVFLLVGAVIGVVSSIAPDVGRWLRRRRTA